jgi:hypothetical protein
MNSMQRGAKRPLFQFAAVMLLALASSTAAAQATRTWVSGVGDDANPCSRTAPCKTFAGAISKTAAGGEIDVLDPGGFGGVTITKAITIDGGDAGGILSPGTNGIVVIAGANDVVRIRNLTINGAGSGLAGIRFLSGKALHVENVRIYGVTGFGIDFVPNSTTAQLFVSDTKISNNNGTNSGGIQVAPSGTGGAIGSIENTRLENSRTGLMVRNGSIVSMRNSVASGNWSNGVVAVSTTDLAEVTVEDSMLVNNGTATGAAGGIWASGPMGIVRISGNVITNNEYGLKTGSGGQIISFGDNKVIDNTIDGSPTETVGTR